jgi:hypothetical protein
MVNMWNGGFSDFQEAAGSHFQTDLLEMEEVQDTHQATCPSRKPPRCPALQ